MDALAIAFDALFQQRGCLGAGPLHVLDLGHAATTRKPLQILMDVSHLRLPQQGLSKF
jgi:hypothetical protein